MGAVSLCVVFPLSGLGGMMGEGAVDGSGVGGGIEVGGKVCRPK